MQMSQVVGGAPSAPAITVPNMASTADHMCVADPIRSPRHSYSRRTLADADCPETSIWPRTERAERCLRQRADARLFLSTKRASDRRPPAPAPLRYGDQAATDVCPRTNQSQECRQRRGPMVDKWGLSIGPKERAAVDAARVKGGNGLRAARPYPMGR